AAGVDALRIAAARIAAKQSEIVLVGGAHNGGRPDLLLLYESGGYALKGDFAPVVARADRGGGLALGSLCAFLVLESADPAARGGRAPVGAVAARRIRPRRARAWRHDRRARAHVGRARARGATGPACDPVRRDRRRAGHGGGTYLPGGAQDRSGTCHRHLYRP